MSIGNRPPQDFPIREEVIVINNDPDPAKAQVVLRTYSPLSSAFQDLEVNMALAPGNPQLAAQLTKRSQGIEDAKRAIFYSPIAGGAIGAARLLPSLVKGGLSRVKGAFVQPSKVPLQITPGSRGLPKSQQQSAGVMIDPTKLEATKLTRSLGQGAKVATPGILGYGALTGLQPTPLTGDDLKQAVEDAKITQAQGEDIADQLDVVGDITKPENIVTTTETEDTNIGEEETPPPAEEEAPPPVKTLEDVGQERFIDPDALIAFVRNVGAGLSTTGQFGSGLTLGSKMAAEERAKRDILEEQQTAEMKKEEALLDKKFKLEKELAQIKKGQDFSKYQDQLIKLNEKSKEVEGLDTTANLFASAKIYLEGGAATGLGPELTSMFNKVVRYFGAETELSDREKAINILDAIANANVQEITGEPEGARISDTDRKVAAELVGNIKKMGSDTQNALDRIELQLNSIKDRRVSSLEDFDILAIGLPFEDVKKYMPTTTLQSGATTADQEISFAGPR
jgi:hypothetical protein